MQTRNWKSLIRAALVVLAATLTACTTIEYRDIQGDFVNAVAADNSWSVSPLGASAADGLYNGIAAQLTDEYIAKLDDRLELNAWLLRAVSEWRLGELSKARTSASNGLAAKQDNQAASRDHVMLAMLDGLIIDSELKTTYQGLISGGQDEAISKTEYDDNSFATNFKTALTSLDNGYKQAGPATPPEVGWFYHYHRWRILSNWLITVTSVQPDEDLSDAVSDAESKLGTDFVAAMEAELAAIPDGHPLRDLINAQSAE